MNDEHVEEDKVLQCTECGSYALAEDKETSEIVCRNCGAVIEEEVYAKGKSQRAFTEEERQRIERTGSPITYTKPSRGMTTTVGKGSLREVSPRKRGQYYRLRKWQKRLDESRDRRMKFALGEIERLVAVLNLPGSVSEEVSRLYEKAMEGGVVKGRRIEHVVAALLYITARNHGTPRSMGEIAEEANIEERELGKTYKYVARELDLRIVPVNPTDFIPRYAAELELPGEVQARARKLIKQAQEEGVLSGRAAESVVASALYLSAQMADIDITQKKVSEIVGVTEVTIRKGYRELIDGLDLDVEMD